MKRLILSMVVFLVAGWSSIVYTEEIKRATRGTELIDTNDPSEALEIETIYWVADGWGHAKWKIKVRNNSTSDWKDILIKGVYFGESGTAIPNSIFDSIRYVVVSSGKSVWIIINVKCPDQAWGAGASISGATLCEFNLCK